MRGRRVSRNASPPNLPGASGPVIVASTRTMWLDEQGRLVIERTGTPRELVPSSRSVYRKQ